MLEWRTLQDRSWLASQPKGTVAAFLDPKRDSGADVLAIKPGAGRHGNDCLAVTSDSPEAGLPGFWMMQGVSTGRSVGNCKDGRGYFVPSGSLANRFEFWCKFDRGFRARSAAKASSNLVVGTYHFDPAKIGRGDVKESDNWHFYHQIVIRHDIAQDDWVHVVLNDIPQHQRGITKGNPAKQPTGLVNYWQSCTRLYIDCVPYRSDSEVGHPTTMLIDGVRFFHEPEPAVTVTMPVEATARVEQETRVPVTLTNKGQVPMTGRVAQRSRYPWTPRLLGSESSASLQEADLTLAAGETRTLAFSVTPRKGFAPGASMLHGVVFVPKAEQRPGNHSKADPRVILNPNVYGYSGPCDAAVAGASTKITVVA